MTDFECKIRTLDA